MSGEHTMLNINLKNMKNYYLGQAELDFIFYWARICVEYKKTVFWIQR